MRFFSVMVTGFAFVLALTAGCGRTETASGVLAIKGVEVHGSTRMHVTVVDTYGKVFLRGNRGLPTKLGGRLLRKASAKGKGRAKKLLEAIKVEVSGKGQERKFVVVAPKGSRGKVEADIELDVPVDADVSVETAKGNVRIFGVHGEIVVDTDKGKVELRGMKGQVRVSVKKGDVFVSGHLEGVDVSAGKGDVRVQWLSGSPTKDGVLRSGKGNVELTVHKLFAASLRMSFSNGLHASGLEVTKQGKGKARVDLGESGKLLALEAPKGSVRVVRLSIVPPRPIRLKGLPGIRGGGPLKRPRTARDIDRLREQDRKRMLEQEHKQRGTKARKPSRRPARADSRPRPAR